MTFTVEVLLKGQEHVVAESLQHDVSTDLWTDDDVRQILHLTLREFERAQNPDADERPVQLRGFSWIVTPLEHGVAIAIEIASGAIVAGPFDVDLAWLTQAITRVMAEAAQAPSRVH
jgi:hypothetical protein